MGVHSHVFLASAVCVFNTKWHTAWKEVMRGQHTHSSTHNYTVVCTVEQLRVRWHTPSRTHTHTLAHTVFSRLVVLEMQTVSQKQGRALSSLIQPNVSWHINPFLDWASSLIQTHFTRLSFHQPHTNTHTQGHIKASKQTHTVHGLPRVNAQIVVIHP